MNDTVLLDTNLIVRYLVGDHEAHAKAAAKVFERSDKDEVTLVILPAVLSECVFVLESFYEQPREKISEVLRQLIGSRSVELSDKAIHVDALKRYGSGTVHFVDCSLAAFAASREIPVVSFDRDFRKFRDVKTINPARP